MEETALPSLHPDALIQIFHKLPIRSLLKSKLVCKEWCSLISDPFFKSNYNPNSIPHHPLNLMMVPRKAIMHNQERVKSALIYEIINGSETRVVTRDQPLPRNISSENHNLIIVGSWNGLVALYCDHGGIITLLNPCTGEAKTVHMMLNPGQYLWGSKDLYGLGYDSSSREYKVVLAERVDNHTSNLFVVSFKHGAWKVKSLCPLMDKKSLIKSYNEVGTVVNGVPHWIASENHCDQVFGQWLVYDQIWFFDQFEEGFRKIPDMPIEWDRKELRSLGALDGKLTAVVSNRVSGREVHVGGFEVWVLTDFANPESWNSLFVIVNRLRHVSPLLSMNDEEVLIDVNWQDQLMIYNHKSHNIRQLQSKMKRKLYDMITYYPTFISPTTT